MSNKRKKLISEENLTIEHIINTNSIDRYKTIVLPKGASTKNYKKNNVVLWLHNQTERQLPIGRCKLLVKDDNTIRVTTQFNKNDPFAVEVFNAYKDGFMNAWSIGFKVNSYEFVTRENLSHINEKYTLSLTEKDIADAEKVAWHGLVVVDNWELLEYSAVPVPGNQDALTEGFLEEANKRGLLDKDPKIEFGIRNDGTGRSIFIDNDEAEDSDFEEIDNTHKELAMDTEIKTTLSTEDQKEEQIEVPAAEAPKEIKDEPINEAQKTEEDNKEVPAEENKEDQKEEQADSNESHKETSEEPKEEKQEDQKEEPSPIKKEEPKVDLSAITDAISKLSSSLDEKISTFKQENSSLKDTVEKLSQEIENIKASLDADNISTIRAVSQKSQPTSGKTGWVRRMIENKTI
jgi:outer membrane biosynthesis protein TonB